MTSGVINADGEAGTGDPSDSGGGSGGAVFMEVQDLSGYGTIRVRGGAGASTGGGGAGGRIAIHTQNR